MGRSDINHFNIIIAITCLNTFTSSIHGNKKIWRNRIPSTSCKINSRNSNVNIEHIRCLWFAQDCSDNSRIRCHDIYILAVLHPHSAYFCGFMLVLSWHKCYKVFIKYVQFLTWQPQMYCIMVTVHHTVFVTILTKQHQISCLTVTGSRKVFVKFLTWQRQMSCIAVTGLHKVCVQFLTKQHQMSRIGSYRLQGLAKLCEVSNLIISYVLCKGYKKKVSCIS